MKMTNYIIIILALWLGMPAAAGAAGSLQSKIDKAPKGAVIEIEQGVYEETIKISKPIVLEGKGNVLLRSCGSEPTVSLNGKGVTLRNIHVEYCGDEGESSGIYVSGSNHILEGLSIKTKRFGVRLDNAAEVIIRDTWINGSKKGNGIDLWQSKQNSIENVVVSNVSDGLYLERSNGNTLRENHIQNSRYGIHLMFSDDNLLYENVSSNNSTGSMVMEATGTVIKNNKFSYNNKNVNAQGLLLYKAFDTDVRGNEFISNRVGIFIEEAEENKVESNKIMDNFIGVQFKKANGNSAAENNFIGNVNDAQAIESSDNRMDGNFWDASSKVDANGNGISEIAFTADPYFLTLTADVPEYQLFFQSPGLILLQNMLKSPTDKLLIDSAPLMDMTMKAEKEKSSSITLWIMSSVMVLTSLSLFILGRKRR
ncbi:nitrous oxide reductase family maturation protein NosD [Mesobacillus zeae]|uniref:Carbohydrate-binding/sugar hydrolysis domain-containing protein n=1 Tax=Mesobacillus zeae TaxID=1917180 RepID=A0A398B1P9_9BACI|nr:NosD domain-containing protein [Mesobacillus zeae]RID82828.1 hypothetical protein D1970_17760 [Mesobacillus zeae]